MKEVQELWQEHEQSKFPSRYIGTLNGVNLLMLSSDLGASIYAYLQGDGVLSSYHSGMLNRNAQTLKSVLPNIDSSNKKYFQRLYDMAELVRGKTVN